MFNRKKIKQLQEHIKYLEDPRGYEFQKLQEQAVKIANDDKLFEKKRDEYAKYLSSSSVGNKYISGIDSAFNSFFMAAEIRREREFIKKHGRMRTLKELFYNK